MKLFGPIIFLALAVAIFFGVTKPLLTDVHTLAMRKSELDSALNNSKALQEKRAAIEKQFNEFKKDDKDNLDKFLPDVIDNIKLIIDLNSVAARYNMALRNTTFASDANENTSLGQDGSPYGAMKLSFRVSGPYAAIKDFLEDLSHSLRLVDTVSLSFRAADTDFYEYDVSIRTYWLR